MCLCDVSLHIFLLPSFASAPTRRRSVENDNTLRIKNEKMRSLLLFANVTEKHFGNYSCFASNRLGSSNASMLLFRKLSQNARAFTLRACKYRKSLKTLAFIFSDFHDLDRSCCKNIYAMSVFCSLPSAPFFFPFSLFSAPLKLCSPILQLLSLFQTPSLPPSLLRTHSRLYTQTVALFCPVTQEVVISLEPSSH